MILDRDGPGCDRGGLDLNRKDRGVVDQDRARIYRSDVRLFNREVEPESTVSALVVKWTSGASKESVDPCVTVTVSVITVGSSSSSSKARVDAPVTRMPPDPEWRLPNS